MQHKIYLLGFDACVFPIYYLSIPYSTILTHKDREATLTEELAFLRIPEICKSHWSCPIFLNLSAFTMSGFLIYNLLFITSRACLCGNNEGKALFTLLIPFLVCTVKINYMCTLEARHNLQLWYDARRIIGYPLLFNYLLIFKNCLVWSIASICCSSGFDVNKRFRCTIWHTRLSELPNTQYYLHTGLSIYVRVFVSSIILYSEIQS